MQLIRPLEGHLEGLFPSDPRGSGTSLHLLSIFKVSPTESHSAPNAARILSPQLECFECFECFATDVAQAPTFETVVILLNWYQDIHGHVIYSSNTEEEAADH